MRRHQANQIPAFSAVIINGGKSSQAKVHNKGLLKTGDETIMERIDRRLSLAKTQFNDCGKLPFEIDPECFTNVNTPEDYERALEVYLAGPFEKTGKA